MVEACLVNTGYERESRRLLFKTTVGGLKDTAASASSEDYLRVIWVDDERIYPHSAERQSRVDLFPAITSICTPEDAASRSSGIDNLCVLWVNRD